MTAPLRATYIFGWWILLAILWVMVTVGWGSRFYQERLPAYDAAVMARDQAAAEYQRQIVDFENKHTGIFGPFMKGWDRDKDPRYIDGSQVRAQALEIIAPPGLIALLYGAFVALLGAAIAYVPALGAGAAHYTLRMFLLAQRAAHGDAQRRKSDVKEATREDQRSALDEISGSLSKVDLGIRVIRSRPNPTEHHGPLLDMQAATGTIRHLMRSPDIAKSVLADAALCRHATQTVQDLISAGQATDRVTLDIKELFHIRLR